ncbi:uncharacterized protein LOC131853117 [Achroia grisella]|uniref:uncharacterized protein LOC131853117 n=1 Tax=Achroia grisella TaxID=688607 RepID=UPI0027D2A376|nr:uncharacterized protein LOC131853117 [Achroia grisella]
MGLKAGIERLKRSMWLSVIVVLVSAAGGGAGARYSEYSGVKMPQYEGGDYDASRDAAALFIPESEDYNGHSPDAPAPFDYKYEEPKENSMKSSSKEEEIEDPWQKPIRKYKSRNNDYYETDKHSPEDIATRYKSSHRFEKHRPRHKSWISDRNVRLNNYNRDGNNEIRDTERDEIISDNVDYRKNKNKNLQDNYKYDLEITTNRIIRRKPRRLAGEQKPSRSVLDIHDNIEDILPDSRLREDEDADEESRSDIPLRQRKGDSPFRQSDDDDVIVKLHKKKTKPGAYPEYNDYYDMKRVHNIKNKLPTLLRRTKVRADTPTPTLLFEDFRRINEEDFIRTAVVTEESKTTYCTTESATTTTISITTTTAALSVSTNSSKELSLAEKSRLSILKKAQRKESFKSMTTTKPPVLLQVTKKLPTVVMVEPAGTDVPSLRAREVMNDSPEHLDKVKRLMRNKLIASAKNIQDLTDNWDDLVCDYIDTSLLENEASLLFTNLDVLVLIPLVGVIFWFV